MIRLENIILYAFKSQHAPLSRFDYDIFIQDIDLNAPEEQNVVRKLPPTLTLQELDIPPFDQGTQILVTFAPGYAARRYPPIPSHWITRRETVKALYNFAREKQFVMVRGTPGSGKTTLRDLLQRHIVVEEPDSLVQGVTRWTYETTPPGILERFDASRDPSPVGFKCVDMRDQRRSYWVLHDDAKESFRDRPFWTALYNQAWSLYKNVRFVVFVSYGTQSFNEVNPMIIFPSMCMELQPTDVFGHGLLFTREEFDEYLELLNGQFEHSQGIPSLSAELKTWMFELSRGHIGAIRALLAVMRRASYNYCHGSDQPVGLTDFRKAFKEYLTNFDPHELLTAEAPFAQGLPSHYFVVEQESLWKILRVTLQVGYATPQGAMYDAALTPNRMGWLTIEDPEPSLEVVLFASPLHRLWVSWIFGHHASLPEKFDSLSLLDVIKDVLPGLPFSTLSEKTPADPFTATFPGAPWQNDFYQALHRLTNGAVLLSPEFGMKASLSKPGRIDLYIKERKWGITLLRDDEGLEGFLSGGDDHLWIQDGTVEDYIILDFRTSMPQKPYPNIEKLHHIVFSEYGEHCTILDCCLHREYVGRRVPVFGDSTNSIYNE